MEEKKYDCQLIVDYKSGKFRTLSAKARINKLKATEIPIHLSLKVSIPETPILKAEGEIRLSQVQISKMIIEEIKEGNGDTK